MTAPRELRLESAKEFATEQIRELINGGKAAAGTRISIDPLAVSLGISRTPVREALWQLASEGLVTITPRVGVFVRHIDESEVLDVYQIKAQLEPLMVRWAIERSTQSDRHQFHSSLRRLETAYAQHSLTRYVKAIEERRGQLLTMANSSVLEDELSVIDGRVRLFRYRNLAQSGSMEASLAQHREIAQKVLDGDAEGGFAAMHEHMLDATRRVRALFVLPTS